MREPVPPPRHFKQDRPKEVEAIILAALNKSPSDTNNLPHQLTSFIGRTTELAELDSLISNPDVRLVILLACLCCLWYTPRKRLRNRLRGGALL